MDPIQSEIERIAELSDDELSKLKDSIIKEYKSVDKSDTSVEAVDKINALADAADAVAAEKSRREEEAASLAAAREAADARILGHEEASAADTTDESEEDIDPETGLPRKKKTEDEAPAEDVVAEASVNEPAESELSVEEPEALAVAEPAAEETVIEDAELASKQPAVQPAELEGKIHPKTDIEVAAESPQSEIVEADVVKDGADEAEVVEDDKVEEKDSEADVAEESESEVDEAEDTDKEEDSEDTVTAAANQPELEAPADRRPVLKAEPTSVPVTITAAAGIPGVTAGTELHSMLDVAEVLTKRLHKMGNTNPGADGEQLPVATFSTTYPEDRHLGADKAVNSERVQAVVNPSAITAAGGLCAPVEVRYDVFSFNEETGRPVRDALAVFSADRGGIRFVTPPVLADLDGAVSLWTLADDVAALDNDGGGDDVVKPCIRVECGEEVVVYTDAIPLCLTFGNMGARAYPELVARHTELGMVWHARYAETRLLTRIGALSTAVTAGGATGGAVLGGELGITRDLLVQVDTFAAGYRNRHRLAGNSPLRVLLPEWVRAAMRADLTKQLPGDGMDATFNLTDATINGFFAARNINVTFFLDGESGQIIGDQAAGTAVSFPTTLVWYLFSEGTFLFLDGGTLDLGLVRDSQLNSTNDYKIFLETFEGVAKIGIESLRISSAVKIAGASAATTDTLS